MTISRRVKVFREKLGMTQPQASERAGISQATWSRIETGQKTPTAGEVLGLSWALGLPFDMVLGASPIRDRIRFAARSSIEVPTGQDEEEADAIKEEMIFLAEFASALTDAGYLTTNGA
jgi:transcriptional regulator with XRE-family HTH domain